MARNEQLIRQHKLLQILERYRFGRTLKELRDELVDELGLARRAGAAAGGNSQQ